MFSKLSSCCRNTRASDYHPLPPDQVDQEVHDDRVGKMTDRIGVDSILQDRMEVHFAPKTSIVLRGEARGEATYAGNRIVKIVYTEGNNAEGRGLTEIHQGHFSGYELNGEGEIYSPESMSKNSPAGQCVTYKGVFIDGELRQGYKLFIGGDFIRTLRDGEITRDGLSGYGIYYAPNGAALIGCFSDGVFKIGKKINPRDKEGLYENKNGASSRDYGIISEMGVFDEAQSKLVQGKRFFANGTVEQVGSEVFNPSLPEQIEKFDARRYDRQQLFEELFRFFDI